MVSQFVFILKIKNQLSFCPFTQSEISVLTELNLGHLCYRLTDVPPQPNSQPDCVFWVCWWLFKLKNDHLSSRKKNVK